jgi:hypothetical protein
MNSCDKKDISLLTELYSTKILQEDHGSDYPFEELSDGELADLARRYGIEKAVIPDAEGGIANRDEVIANLRAVESTGTANEEDENSLAGLLGKQIEPDDDTYIIMALDNIGVSESDPRYQKMVRMLRNADPEKQDKLLDQWAIKFREEHDDRVFGPGHTDVEWDPNKHKYVPAQKPRYRK